MACNDIGLTRTAGKTGRSSSRRLLGGTMLFKLAQDEVFTATSLVGNGAFDEYVLTGDDFEGLGPAAIDIITHSEGSNFSANFTYDLVLQYKFEGGSWQTATPNLLALKSDGNYYIGTPYNDRTKLGMRIRIVLRTQVSAGSTATQKGNLTISAAVRIFSGCCRESVGTSDRIRPRPPLVPVGTRPSRTARGRGMRHGWAEGHPDPGGGRAYSRAWHRATPVGRGLRRGVLR